MTDKQEPEDKVTYTRPKDEGEVDKRRLAAVMGAAGTATMIALITFFSIGMVGAAMGVGIGGFVANFENVSYNDNNAEIYPVIGSNAACDDAPQLEASLGGEANLYGGVEFFKDLPLPDAFSGPQDFARITIVGTGGTDGIKVTDLDLRLTALETQTLNLSGADIQEFGPDDYGTTDNSTTADGSYVTPGSPDVLDTPDNGSSQQNTAEFGIAADSFNLPNGGTAAVHQVSLGQISLQDVNIAVQILNESQDTDNGPVTRVVNMDERSCEGLAEASTSANASDWDNASGGLQLADPSA